MSTLLKDEEKCKSRLKALADKLGLSHEEIVKNNYSKKQLKRMVKNLHYNQFKAEKRQIQKMKKKAKRQDLKDKGLLNTGKPSRISMYESPNKVKIAIDLSFNDLMNDRERGKLLKQIQRCYSYNRNSSAPCQFYLTSITEPTIDRMSRKQPGIRKWEVFQDDKHFLEAFKDHKENKTLIFLSPNSPNVLPDVSEIRRRGGDYVYIIGGLVDHNVQKGLTLQLAEESGINHARLPIDECMKLFTSHVLSVNQVFEIMVDASLGIPWEDSLLRVVPQRKQRISKEILAKKQEKVDQLQDKLSVSINQAIVVLF